MEEIFDIEYNGYKKKKNSYSTKNMGKYFKFVPNGGNYQYRGQNNINKKLFNLFNKKISKNKCDITKFFTGNFNILIFLYRYSINCKYSKKFINSTNC